MQQIYQLKVTLTGFRPPIWRRLLIASDATFFDLHSLIQDAFDWEDYHLHSFKGYRNKGKKRIYIQDPITNEEWQYPVAEELLPPIEERDEFLNEHETKLSKYLNQEFPKFTYEYDFGDSWIHEIVLEKDLEKQSGVQPTLTAGQRLGPPEDSRGWIHNAEEIVKASRDKKSKAWLELIKAWGKETAEDFVLMSRDFLLVPFNSGDVSITDPKERIKNYENQDS